MNLTLTFTLLLVAMAALETKSGPIFFRCQCTKILPDGVKSGRNMNPASVRAITRYPAGAHCKYEEVIIDLIRRKLCVNPKAPWVIAMERKIQLRSATFVTSNATINTTSATNVTTNATITAIQTQL